MTVRIDCEFNNGDWIEVRHSAGLITIVSQDTSISTNKKGVDLNMVELTPEKARGLINEISKAIKAEERKQDDT